MQSTPKGPSRLTSSSENFQNLSRNLVSIFNLIQNSNLHIVNEQGTPFWIANLFEGLWYPESKRGFHNERKSPR
jgi:hypothetical protein